METKEIPIYMVFNDDTKQMWIDMWMKCSKDELTKKLFSANDEIQQLKSKIEDLESLNNSYANDLCTLVNKIEELKQYLKERINQVFEFDSALEELEEILQKLDDVDIK